MNDIKVMDTLRELEQAELNANLPIHPIAFFAENLAVARRENSGISIEDIAKCFKAQFDEAELESLIKELKL